MPEEYVDLDEEFEEFLEELEDYVKNPSEYVKYEMPNFEEPFTDEEKKAFEDEYTKAVNAFNKVLPDNMKLDLDLEGFHKKMNDPKQVEMYRRISFINELSAKKDKIQKYYKSTFDKEITQKKEQHPIGRIIPTLMRADGSEASETFNKKLMNFYYKYPNEVSQAVLKGIFKADSKVYEGILKDDYERCKVYTDNFERSYMAYEVKHVLDVMENDGKIVDELKNSPMIILLQAQSSLKTNFGSIDSFAMPKITMDQFEKITHQSIPDTVPFFGKISGVVLGSDIDNVKKDIKLLKDKGYLNDEETALTYKAIETKDGKEKEINLLDALKSKDPNVKIEIVKRSEEEKQNMLNITTGLKHRYEVRCFKKEFVSSYNAKDPQTKIDKFDQSKILDNHKGGFFERLFNTTSKEYKEFVENFKKYTDPENPDISVKDKLIESAKAYIEHKNVSDVVDLAALEDGTGKERVKLCLSVLSSLNVEEGSFKLIEDNPVVEEKKDNIVRVQVDGLEKDTNIEKSNKPKEKNKVETKNKTIIKENDISKN
jgi:hypothetical protein